jgi:hypothetical protein
VNTLAKEKRIQKNNTAARRNDEYLTYRIMLAFLEAAVGLLLMSRLYAAIDTPTTYDIARLVCLIIAAAAGASAVIGVASYLAAVRRNTHQAGRVFNGMFLAAAAAVAGISALILYVNYNLGMPVIYVFIPVSAVLFVLYSVYPKTVFVTSATHSFVAMAIYALRLDFLPRTRVIILCAGLAVCGLAVILYFATAKNDGCIRIAGVNLSLFGRHANRRYLLILYAVTAVVLVAAYLLGGAFAFYATWLTVAFIVASVIAATVRMMR